MERSNESSAKPHRRSNTLLMIDGLSVAACNLRLLGTSFCNKLVSDLNFASS